MERDAMNLDLTPVVCSEIARTFRAQLKTVFPLRTFNARKQISRRVKRVAKYSSNRRNELVRMDSRKRMTLAPYRYWQHMDTLVETLDDLDRA